MFINRGPAWPAKAAEGCKPSWFVSSEALMFWLLPLVGKPLTSKINERKKKNKIRLSSKNLPLHRWLQRLDFEASFLTPPYQEGTFHEMLQNGVCLPIPFPHWIPARTALSCLFGKVKFSLFFFRPQSQRTPAVSYTHLTLPTKA